MFRSSLKTHVNQLQQLTRPFANRLSQQARNAVRSGDLKMLD